MSLGPGRGVEDRVFWLGWYWYIIGLVRRMGYPVSPLLFLSSSSSVNGYDHSGVENLTILGLFARLVPVWLVFLLGKFCQKRMAGISREDRVSAGPARLGSAQQRVGPIVWKRIKDVARYIF